MSYQLIHEVNTKGYGSGRPIFADVNGDGRMELVLAQAWPMNREIACVTVVDLDGNSIWVTDPERRFGILTVRWLGDRDCLLLQYPEEAVLQDLTGKVFDRFPLPQHPGGWRAHALDLCNDSREELLLSNNDAYYIYSNTAPWRQHLLRL